MQIVLHDDVKILDIIKDVGGIVISGKNIDWNEGRLGEVGAFFVIVDDTLIVELLSLDEIKLNDKSSDYKKESTEEIMQRLTEENEMNSLAIMELAEMMLGG